MKTKVLEVIPEVEKKYEWSEMDIEFPCYCVFKETNNNCVIYNYEEFSNKEECNSFTDSITSVKLAIFTEKRTYWVFVMYNGVPLGYGKSIDQKEISIIEGLGVGTDRPFYKNWLNNIVSKEEFVKELEKALGEKDLLYSKLIEVVKQ
jgi:hypothetical protein